MATYKTEKKTAIKKDIDYYLDLPWTYTIETTKEDGDLLYIVYVNELPGVATDAPTLPEAMTLIKDAMRGIFKLYLEQGEEIPEPMQEEQFKGNIAYRTTNRRHLLLAKEAKKRDVSLSSLIDECIDKTLQRK